MTTVFLLLAGALALASAWLLLSPLLRKREDSSPAHVAAGVLLVAILVGGGALYAAFSNFTWGSGTPVANMPAAAAARLARELARDPDHLEGWLELGGRYFDLEQYPLAIRAYQRADRLANNQNPDALSGLAESMLAQDFETIRGAAGRLFERVLEMQPDNPKALLYSALAAMGRDERELARARFQRILALNPREDIRDIIIKQLQALDATELMPAAGQATTPGAAAGDAARVSVSVRVSEQLKYSLSPNAVLFIAARDPAQPGPPFAAKRLPVQFPVDVTLTAADAMMPSRRISAGQKLEIVARISLTGQPTSSPGDLFGKVDYHVGTDGKLNLVIDQTVP